MRALVCALTAAFVVSCACDHDHSAAEPEPACASPAPLVPAAKGRIVDRYIVEMHDYAETDALVARHYLEVEGRLPIVKGFVATMRPATVTAIRCDPAVARVTEDRAAEALTN